ncbi:dolichyl-phosphate-mannose--protein mannosyltransferase [Planotetraspora kaengkrachanensis]|uniref:Polyprenol-phosphate-mannose--protein mannosyltransferase n=1 Tax=Planotetraspora kaengkrachanensis TaxID=575193 RepID=A0A8J3PUB1_9ACTN|nr:phospholipid carrier-dependent glycosyltransferase [Planotetraspora kaengkrachanensis]GIG81170.1 phospholipid carrier-dependent glycosyltransferase [Planotetraspora kaengkrachanensis]
MAQTFERAVGEPGGSAPSVRDRLVPPMPGSRLWGWLGPLIVAVFGGILRFDRLGTPNAVVFDETYYAKDAFSTITHGVERQFVDGADALMLGGNTQIFKTCAPAEQCGAFVAHPPLGKWMIGIGEWLFGLTPFGWRFMAALVGTASLFILARVARRLTRSTLLGCLAGFLLALDALHFVLSRTALLDVFLMFWVLAGFACLVVDRDRGRERLVDWYQSSAVTAPWPRLGLRPWRLAAGLCLGAALATKWTGAFFILAFTIMALLWDAGARRAIGLPRPYRTAWRLDWPLGVAWTVAVPVVTWVASYAGWFATDKGWGRNWEQATSNGWAFFVFDSLRSWMGYQDQVLGFHEGLTVHHDYQSWPWQWPLLLRPVSFHYQTPTGGCGADMCSSAVLATGTPVIWLGALGALLALIVWYFSTRDWRAGAVLGAYLAGWLPWFYFAMADHRTMFLFYALPMVPFMILAIVLAAGLIIGPVGASARRRVTGTSVVGAFALLALVNFWWLSPVLTATTISYQDWLWRMIPRSWI